jgi:hypothetical protein
MLIVLIALAVMGGNKDGSGAPGAEPVVQADNPVDAAPPADAAPAPDASPPPSARLCAEFLAEPGAQSAHVFVDQAAIEACGSEADRARELLQQHLQPAAKKSQKGSGRKKKKNKSR